LKWRLAPALRRRGSFLTNCCEHRFMKSDPHSF
jgi:hypothetical protein